MGHIHVLDQSTIDKIAAGEVVERPASVVKELVENAVDAGADRITVEIRDGGISLIRVTDNGAGIEEEDLPLAFLRHATSKLTEVSELAGIRSLGFRGEALSSIAAVSRVELITKRRENLSGSRCVVEGGREKVREEVGAPDGTTVVVRDLFYNTPARAKFLKTPASEGAYVGNYVEQLALSNPGISFTLIANGRRKLATGGNGNIKDIIYNIYGRELPGELVPCLREEGGFRVEGLIGKPSVARGNRAFENYYVNGRYVKSRVLTRAIEDGYGTSLMNHQYPFTCLVLTVDGSGVDVNVHPTKMDVRFSDEKMIYDFLREAVRSALEHREMVVPAALGEKRRENRKSVISPVPALKAEAGDRSHPEEIPEKTPEDVSETVAEKNPARQPGYSAAQKALSEQLLTERGTYTGAALVRDEARPSRTREKEGQFVQQTFAPAFLSKEAKSMRRIVGQVFGTYWICEFDDKMYLFDQHAAHEKVLFERFMKQYAKQNILTEPLIPPLVVSLSAREEETLLTSADAFAAAGFVIEVFGERSYVIREIPTGLAGLDSEDLFREMLDSLDLRHGIPELDAYVHRVATEACKAAVKGGDLISREQAEQLLDDLLSLEDPYHCPHGRPTIISFTRQDLEKRFHRIL